MAKGSHKELGTYPRICSGCGEKVRITKDYMTQMSIRGVKTSWHTRCWLERSEPFHVCVIDESAGLAEKPE